MSKIKVKDLVQGDRFTNNGLNYIRTNEPKDSRGGEVQVVCLDDGGLGVFTDINRDADVEVELLK